MKHQKAKNQKISRKEALNKISKYGKNSILTALGTYLILDPKKAQSQSPENPGIGF
jgi:hypothetical protein